MVKKIIAVAIILIIILSVTGFLFLKSKSESKKVTIPTTEQIQEKENGLQTIPNNPTLPK